MHRPSTGAPAIVFQSRLVVTGQIAIIPQTKMGPLVIFLQAESFFVMFQCLITLVLKLTDATKLIPVIRLGFADGGTDFAVLLAGFASLILFEQVLSLFQASNSPQGFDLADSHGELVGSGLLS